ncbi:MAG: hypothetical protein ABEH43_07155, partial [Flavobacteriales bacterium]
MNSGTKFTLTNQHSLAINQNSNSLRVIGFDAVVTPGFQYFFKNDLDNASQENETRNYKNWIKTFLKLCVSVLLIYLILTYLIPLQDQI